MSQANSAKNANFHINRIRSGEVYSTAEIVESLQVSRKTVSFWYRVGLEYTPVSFHPKAKRIVSGDDLIFFLKCYGLAIRIMSMMGELDEEEAEEDPETEEG